MGDAENSVKWFNMLSSRVPTDPGILYDLGTLYANENDEAQSYSSYLESFRYYPINIDVISWLGLYFVKHEIYEKALLYFERASQIQPNEINWKLMVASCHRRIGAFQQAKKCYEQIHIKHPENIECLRYLVQICTELGLKKERKHYAKQLTEVEESQRQKKNEDKVDGREFTYIMAEDDTMKKTMEQVTLQKESLMKQKKEEEIRQKEQEELKRLRVIEEEYLALKKAGMAKPGKKGVTFAETEEMIHKNIVNDKLVENIEDEFMHIDDGIDGLYS
jgi:tetratricopeptide (TPR) repeat protein